MEAARERQVPAEATANHLTGVIRPSPAGVHDGPMEVGPGMIRARGSVTIALAAVLSVALIVAAVRVGMRVPALSDLSGLGASSILDYGRLTSGLSPLSPAFIERVLGASRSAGSRSGEAARFSTYPQPGSGGGGRTVARHLLTNDDFVAGYRIASVPFTANTDASDATREASEPRGCAPVGEQTVWYQYRAPTDMGLIANTIGTARATSLAVYTGGAFGDLTPVEDACHTSVRGSAYVTFPARQGVTYHFQITGIAEGGPLVFNLDPLGTTEIVSGGDSTAGWHSISADGRFVAFSSASSDLLDEPDPNDWEDMFVRDLETGAIEMVSVSSDGDPGNRESEPWRSAISADGRFVAFTSRASNLVDGDTNDAEDVFVHDRRTRETTRVSVSSEGAQGIKPVRGLDDPVNAGAHATQEPFDDYNKAATVSMSADGRYVVFDSNLTGLVSEDEPGAEDELGEGGRDVFRHDRWTGQTTLVSASSDGANGDAISWLANISADGRYVTFSSSASNLLRPPSASLPPVLRTVVSSQIYVRDMQTGSVELVSAATDGDPGNDKSLGSTISADGRYVAFYAVATDLVPNDANGSLLDVFVRDRLLGRTEIVSLTSSGEQGFGGQAWERAYLNAQPPSLSWDGRYVAFHSDSPLVPGDTDESENVGGRVPLCDVQNEDVFLRDRLTGTTTRVSDSTTGEKGNGASAAPAMSADGRRVAFVSVAENLARDRASDVPMSCWESMDVFIHTFPVLR